MIGDLPLGYEPEPPQRKRTAVALAVGVLLAVALACGAVLGYRSLADALRTPDYTGTGTAEKVEVEIKPGATQAEIAKALAGADVIRSPKAFVEAGRDNDEALRIQPGLYRLNKRMSAEAAVRALLDPQNRIVQGVVIPEGLITVEIYQRLADELGLKVEDFVRAAQDPVRLGVPQWWFSRMDGTSMDSRSVEGFLFPATYDFPPHITAEAALGAMVHKFLSVTGGLDFAARVQKDRGISPYEALIAASIVESEVQTPADMGKAARAVYNRVYTERHECRCLQLDAAINYYYKISGQKAKDPNEFRMSEIHNPDNPYNTHIRPGMPVSPISNPGENALSAAMDTPVGNWLYWVTVDTKGTTLFADDYPGHLANIKLACQNGVLSGELC